jgi:hypothetical protein
VDSVLSVIVLPLLFAPWNGRKSHFLHTFRFENKLSFPAMIWHFLSTVSDSFFPTSFFAQNINFLTTSYAVSYSWMLHFSASKIKQNNMPDTNRMYSLVDCHDMHSAPHVTHCRKHAKLRGSKTELLRPGPCFSMNFPKTLTFWLSRLQFLD